MPNIGFVSYADDNTPFVMGSSEVEVINEIKTAAESFTLWFQNNCIKVHPDKFHLLLTDKKVIRWIFVMTSSQVREKNLGIKINNKLIFQKHLEELRKKPINKSVCCQEFNL